MLDHITLAILTLRLAILTALMRTTDRAIIAAGNLHRAVLASLSTGYVTALARRNAIRDHREHGLQARPVLGQAATMKAVRP